MNVLHIKKSALTVFILFLFTHCFSGYTGDLGPTITEKRKVEPFTKIENGINADIYITQGDLEEISIKAQEKVLKELELDVKNGKLSISLPIKIKIYERVQIHIKAPSITHIALMGSGSVLSENVWNLDDLHLSITGSGDIKAKFNVRNLTGKIAGSGDMNLNGVATFCDFNIAGSGNFLGQDLQTEDMNISIAGSGDAKINVSKSLKVRIAGSGSVLYKGDPKTVDTDIAGSGKCKKIG